MTLTPEALYQLARQAGFPPDTAVTMVAIALKESGGNPTAHNPVPPDDSYGLWQINMLGSLGATRLAQFGLASKTQLYDPLTNARAAFMIWGGNDRNLDIAWAIEKSPINRQRYLAYLPRAEQARQAVEPAPVVVAEGSAAAGADSAPETLTHTAGAGAEDLSPAADLGPLWIGLAALVVLGLALED